MDAANLLKPALARGTLHCIGATTLNEYQKYIEKDAALERRFQPVIIEEPTLKMRLPFYGDCENAMRSFMASASQKLRSMPPSFLSYRYITDRSLPDKAIDLIDEAASLIRMQLGSLPLPIDTKGTRTFRPHRQTRSSQTRRHPSATAEAEKLEEKSLNSKKSLHVLRQHWEQEKKLIDSLKEKKNQLEQLRFQEEEAERKADYNKVAEIRYSQIPAACKKRWKKSRKN